VTTFREDEKGQENTSQQKRKNLEFFPPLTFSNAFPRSNGRRCSVEIRVS
jgi:hypothetical protein